MYKIVEDFKGDNVEDMEIMGGLRIHLEGVE